MKKILVPTDFSKPAQIAVSVASNIALKAGAKVILLHIIEQRGGDSYNVSGEASNYDSWEDKLFTMKLIEKSKNQLEAEAEGLKNKGVKVSTEIRLGNAYHGMQTIITEKDVDLVVMGTSGKSKLEEMIIGSNTEKVIRYAHCPVLTINGKPGSTEYKNIVYATSLTDSEKDFSKILKTTQELFKSTIHLVRVNTPSNFQSDAITEKQMQDFVAKTKLQNYTLNIYNDFSEEEGIIHFAESIDADLVAMATHGRKGFAHVLVGSIAEEVASHSRRPVLTYVIK
jgi:nucleotide-binding universal stress UspA family protein